MFEDVKKLITEYVLPTDKIAVAVSGGADSVCLLHLAAGCLDKKNVAVLNFNHQIRETESDRDTAFVKSLCQKWGLEALFFSADIPLLSEKSGKSLETQAREWRLGVYEDLVRSGRVRLVLTAHHKDDDTESILMHLFRGAGINGLCGMRMLSRNGLFRPLLKTRRAQIEEYIKENGLPYVTDSTNSSSFYARNFVRNDVIPLIESRWQGLTDAVAALKDEAQTVAEFMDAQLDMSFISVKCEGVYISKNALSGTGALPPRYILKALSFLDVTTDVSRDNINSIIGLKDKRTGAKFEFSGIRAVNEYENLFLTRIDNAETSGENGEAPTKNAPQVPFTEGKIRIDGKTILISRGGIEEGAGKTLYFDINKVPQNAVVRFRREGDVFKPYGGNRKKLKSYLIDKKIPQRLRDAVPLIAVNGEVLIVIGIEIGDEVKAEENGEKCYIAEIKPQN